MKAGLLEFAVVTYKFAVEEIPVNASVPIVSDAVEKMYTLFNKLQLWKALSPMEVTLVGITILVNEEQPEKAPAAILVTLVGIVILVNPVQLWKALAAILVTLVGIVILVNPIQFWKALSGILVTLVGIVILVNEEQPEKAVVPMEVTLVGIVITCTKLVSPLKPDKLVGVPVVVYVNPRSLVVQVHSDNGFVIVTGLLKTNVKSRIYLFAKGFEEVVKPCLLEFILVTYKFAFELTYQKTSVPIVIDAVEKMYALVNELQI